MSDTDQSSSTRTLHQLTLPTKFHVPAGTATRRGLYVDCETTGRDWARDEVIEIAMLPFRYTLDGRIVEVLEDEAQSYRRDPGRALSAETTALTGLTDDDVRGRHIDVEAASALVERSDLLIAHNARFDRPFFEQVLSTTRAKPWGCSRLDVPWLAAGCPSDALHCLLCSYGVYARERHRAMADCEAGVWVLSQVLPGTDRPVLAALREQAMKETLRLWAVGIPIGAKDELRGRGYPPAPRAVRSTATSAEAKFRATTTRTLSEGEPHPARKRSATGARFVRPSSRFAGSSSRPAMQSSGEGELGRAMVLELPLSELTGNILVHTELMTGDEPLTGRDLMYAPPSEQEGIVPTRKRHVRDGVCFEPDDGCYRRREMARNRPSRKCSKRGVDEGCFLAPGPRRRQISRRC